MKKILFILICSICSIMSFSQGKVVTNITNESCFCCDGNYQLTPPIISGPTTALCGTQVKFTWPKCKGVVVGRNYTPFPPGASGGGDDVSSYFNIPSGYSGIITFTVSFQCGDKTITSQKQFTVDCCKCDSIPNQFSITGPSNICLKPNCNDLLKYTVPLFGSKPCYTQEWSISPSLPYGLVGVNEINIKCSLLQPNTTYTITHIVKCGDKVVKSQKTLNVCPKPIATFTATVDNAANKVTFTSTSSPSCTKKWYFFEDVNKNCVYDPGTDGGVTGQFGNTATFTGLVAGKQYSVHYYVECECGPNGEICRTLQPYCFIYMPAQMAKPGTGGSNNGLQEISNLEINDAIRIESLIKQFNNVSNKKN
jgi:hypothetical protein